ncbi:unnamed protein product [Spirodela intermedia]|uniref:Uncharacterized protein n=1 Tax=Spirodela intermedia TaxID=51605 RepID=A0A7I8JDF6_SPIIN|nr:unnamed protein product [Spirodela intermedia]CAA6667422.1 unnamed protein product [Spirodela intermedia]
MNERERAAELRHQEARPFLVKAHECFLHAAELLSVLPTVTRDDGSSQVETEAPPRNFIELGSVWQASHWEISLCLPPQGKLSGLREKESTQSCSNLCAVRTMMPLFDNPVANETDDDLDAEFLNSRYILPSKSCLHMSDLRRIHDLILDHLTHNSVISAAHSDYGFNLIVIDPPWENASACQKSLYPTLPSRYFLYIPVRQLAHTQGALVALWVTNREKLRIFVEKELFPAWGVTDVSIFYWLKVKDDGSLIGDLDLFHHRPYECLVLGYINSKEICSGCDVSYTLPQSNQVIISIPSAYSRKPPLGKLLSEYVPGPRPGKFVELFARELQSGWTCWGNEPLCFQDARYFVKVRQ